MESITVEADPDSLETEMRQRRRPADRDEDLMAVDCRAVREVDGVGARGARFWSDPDRSDAGPDVDAVAPQGSVEGRRVARMILRVDAIVRRDEDRRHAVAGEHLRHLDAGRTGAEHDQALR